MKFVYQKYPSDKAVRVAKVTSERIPILIDYSDKYGDNQPKQLDEFTYRGGYGLQYILDANVFYVGGVGFSIDDDQIILTTKATDDAVPLYYQYQPKLDIIHPENIVILDGDNKEIDKYIEYGYVRDLNLSEDNSYPLNNNIVYDFDTLDTHTDTGDPTDIIYSSINSLKDEDTSKYDNLRFNIYGDCMGGGSVLYSSDMIPTDGSLEFYFAIREVVPGGTFSLISGDTWDIRINDSLQVIADSNSTALDYFKWCRIKLNFKTGEITLYSDSKNETIIYTGLAIEDFTIDASYSYIFDLATFEDVSYTIEWKYPLFAFRYSKTLLWTSDKPTGGGPYRVRILLPDNQQYTMIYDGIDQDGLVYRNTNEWVSPLLIYKKYSNITANDWYYDGVSKIYFVERAHDDLIDLSGIIPYKFPAYTEQELSDILETMRIYAKPTEKSRVNVSVLNDRVQIQNGVFKSDDYDGLPTGNTDYYYIPEYRLVPFASDNQALVEPRYLKLIKDQAEILDDNTIQIGSYFFYDGTYPEYIIPNTLEKGYDIDTDTIIDLTTETIVSYRNARGVNIYVNNNLIDNSLILEYNMSQGLIKLNMDLSIRDIVEVTYLNKMDSFPAPYPRLGRDLGTWDSFRIYLRSYFSNYSLKFPVDEIERACYRTLVNGIPSGPLLSCLTNEEVRKDIYGDYIPLHSYSPDKDHPNYMIGDINMIEAITIEDAREYGGGIVESEADNFPFYKSYLDIMNANGLRIPQAITFIKIPTALMTNLIDEYISNGKTKNDAIDFLKKHIEKHIGLGVFYVLIDENDQMIEQPFAKMEDK